MNVGNIYIRCCCCQRCLAIDRLNLFNNIPIHATIMGTRGLVGHIVRSKNLRKGSYNHFDSYPSGLGRDIALFILGLTDEQIETMIENLGKIEW